MSDAPIRKKLSLKSKRQVNVEDNPISVRIQWANKALQKGIFEQTPELAALNKERETLLVQIRQMDNRLQFAASEPLRQAAIELKKKDFKMLSQMCEMLEQIEWRQLNLVSL